MELPLQDKTTITTRSLRAGERLLFEIHGCFTVSIQIIPYTAAACSETSNSLSKPYASSIPVLITSVTEAIY